jgi:hypothetical protein
MKKILYTTIIAAMSFAAKAQSSESFEDITLDSGKVLNGMLGEKEYTFDIFTSFTELHLPTSYDTSFGGYWASGWALSRKFDSATVASNSARHIYCNKAYSGFGPSNTFALGQNHSYFYADRATKFGISGFRMTNTTYAHNSMKFGDAFGKKFGGTSGNDSDYFFCRVKAYHFGDFLDSQDIYLADFRDSNNTKDYILSEWTNVNLPSLTDSVTFDLYSSDNSPWGMNTPGFFALDDIGYVIFENVQKLKNSELKVWPNPAKDMLFLSSTAPLQSFRIISIDGRTVFEKEQSGLRAELNTAAWDSGVYIAEITTTNGISRETFLVQHQ